MNFDEGSSEQSFNSSSDVTHDRSSGSMDVQISYALRPTPHAQGAVVRSTGIFISLLAAALIAPGAAIAQRANENAVRQAGDAFGTSVGNERIGIYNPFSARGFSPVQAGNVRLEGLYLDLQADLETRLISGVNVRVGISAQSYPFSAPTGIADYSVRRANDQASASVQIAAADWGPTGISIDAQVPVTAQLSVSLGTGYAYETASWGADRDFLNAAIVPRWRPNENVEIIPFVSWWRSTGVEAQSIVFTAGSFLPPETERRQYFGPSWATSDAQGLNAGLLATARSGGWTFRAGLFHSELYLRRSATELALNTTREGLADRFAALERDRRNVSRSGELRATRTFTEGPRQHQLHFALRGREGRRLYGGGTTVALGRALIDTPIEIPEPNFVLGPRTRDRIRQGTVGIGYDGRWRDVGELSISVQQTDYRKAVQPPAGAPIVSTASPLLINGTVSVQLSPVLSLYGGYARGLEESPVAPTFAINRDEAPPALITRQIDAGFRWRMTEGLRLVAGVFQVSKPYFALDANRFFGGLGEVRHRGVEISVAGTLAPGLTLVLGTILLDAEVSGAAVEQGLIGRRPIGTYVRYTNGALDWQLPFLRGASVDLAHESTSDRASSRFNTLVIPPRALWHVGARYRFNIAGRPAVLRAQAANIFGNFGWSNSADGFFFNNPRRISLTFTADI